MSISLSVNLNKIALIRNSRDGNYPDIAHFAKLCTDVGAKGLTAHPRPDQRHIRPSDIHILSAQAMTAKVEFNIEGNPFAAPLADYPGLLALAQSVRPQQCTLVPDSDDQKTSDHGFDLQKDAQRLAPIIAELKAMHVRVSLFMDPDPEQIKRARDLGADRIELYTGPFAWAYERSNSDCEAVFAQHCRAAETAQSCGLGINAGHDLNLENMTLYKSLPGLQEVSIGHALTVDALLMGFEPAIKAYLEICE